MRPVRASAVVLLAAAALTGGCDDELDCSELDGRDSANAGTTVFLIDVTASAHVGTDVPDYAAGLGKQIAAAVQRGDVVSVGSFDGSASTVSWTAENKLTRSDRTREDRRDKDREEFRDCLRQYASTAADAAARTTGTDILGAIGVGSRQQAPAKGRLTVVVATDGLSTTGCVDLSTAETGNTRWIDSVAEECPTRPEWPAALAGASLAMVGVGQPATGQPVPETGHQEFLRQLWERICLAAGARTCEISTAPVSRGEGGGKAAFADPAVTFAAGQGPPVQPPVIVHNLSAEVLFDTDKSELLPAGRVALDELLRTITATPPAAVEVVGFADSRHTVAHNLGLSKRRAAAVAGHLGAGGMVNVRSRGVGEGGRRLCTDERLPSGDWNEACLRLDRRVEVRVQPVSGS